MSDNIYGENNQFNPYVKKEDAVAGDAAASADAQNAAQNASANAENDIPSTESADAQANTAEANGEDAASQASDAQASNAQDADAQNAASQAPGAQSTGGQTAGAQNTANGAPSHTFSQNGQYSMVHPQGGTTYIPPRPNPQNTQTQYNAQNQQNSGCNPGTQQTYQRPYTTYTPGAYGYQTQYTQTPPQPPRKEKKRGASVGVVALLCAICVLLSGAAGFAGAYLSFGLRGSDGNAPILSGGDTAVIYRSVSTDSEAKTEASLNDVVTAVENSVVEITTEFQSMGYFQYVTSGAGSGVIISENGYIITNNHVITSENKVADAITVRLKNGDEYEAAVIGYDADSDIAVIKIDGEGLTSAVFADSSSLVVGQDIVAIGNPLGELGGTVTEGIISALDREVDVDGTTMNLLQISAAVNPGNSGGGLFNMKGELVGIVNAKSSGEGIEGLGFAIPSNDASRIAEELMTNGYVTGKPYIGVSLYYASDAYTAYRYFQSQVPGLYIAEVVEGYNDGVLEVGDRVIAVNGNEISTSDDIKNYVNECEIGDTMTFSLYRGGKLVEVDVTCYEYVPENAQVSFN